MAFPDQSTAFGSFGQPLSGSSPGYGALTSPSVSTCGGIGVADGAIGPDVVPGILKAGGIGVGFGGIERLHFLRVVNRLD
jgi:hypothetical protein